MKRTIGIAVVAVVAGLAMTAGAVELNAVKAGDISGMTVTETAAVPEAARSVSSKTMVTPATANWQDTLQVDQPVYAMLESGSLKSAAAGTAGRATIKELSLVLASGPLPGGCSLEVNAFRASAFQPGTGDNLNVGIMKGGEYTDILMVGVAQAAASSGGRQYAYESVACPSDNWVGRCEKDSFTLATDAGGRITSVSIERAKEKSGLLRGGWKVTSAVFCR